MKSAKQSGWTLVQMNEADRFITVHNSTNYMELWAEDDGRFGGYFGKYDDIQNVNDLPMSVVELIMLWLGVELCNI